MFTIGDQKVYEPMPAGIVDLDKCTVCSWPVVEESPDLIDKVTEAGVVVLYNTKNFKGDALGATDFIPFMFPENIYWGKTAADEHGFCDILVDVPEITQDILMALYVMGVIPEPK